MKYLDYAKHIEANEFVVNWVNTTLKNYLADNTPPTEEVEHIIDFLAVTDKKISRMSYEQAKVAAEKWLKAQIKKGRDIIEAEGDTELLLDFGDGFKIVKLIGANAYKREGYLMSHCVGSYFGNDKEIYSLRDKDNMPHCTMEQDQQIKGKGNGDIHPKYVDYVVQFLEKVGMTVGESEMEHLGYANAERFVEELSNEAKELLYADKYFPIQFKDKFTNLKGDAIMRLDILDVFPLIEKTESSIRVAFYIPLMVSASVEWIRNSIKQKPYDKSQIGGNESQLAGGKWSQMVGGNESQLAGGNESQMVGGDRSKIAGGGRSKIAGGDRSQIAGGYRSHIAGGNESQLAGGNWSQIAGGDWSKIAGGGRSQMVGGGRSKIAGGDRSKIAGGNESQLAGGNWSQMVGGNESQLAGGNWSQLAGGNWSQIAGGGRSQIAGGESSIIAGDDASIAKGGLGSVIVLVERDDNYKIIGFAAGQVDGKLIKADTWYKCENNKLVETQND